MGVKNYVVFLTLQPHEASCYDIFICQQREYTIREKLPFPRIFSSIKNIWHHKIYTKQFTQNGKKALTYLVNSRNLCFATSQTH